MPGHTGESGGGLLEELTQNIASGWDDENGELVANQASGKCGVRARKESPEIVQKRFKLFLG
jgi:hypothetical protein